MPPTCRLTSSSLSIVSSSPVPKRFYCKRYWIRVCLRSLILFHESVDFFISRFLTLSLSLICSGQRASFISPPKFPWVIAINVRSPSSRRFWIPSVSSIAGPFTKLSAPNVTNKAIRTTIDRYFHYCLEEFFYQVVRDFRVIFCQEGRSPSGSPPF